MRSAASRLYRLLLYSYPETVRRELGPEMLQTFEDRWAREGTPGLLLRECLDVVATGCSARRKRPVFRTRPRKGTAMELLCKDLRHAARSLLRSPGFTSVALLLSLSASVRRARSSRR